MVRMPDMPRAEMVPWPADPAAQRREGVAAADHRQAAEQGKRVRQACLERGVLLGLGGTFGNVLRIQPPLVIDKSQMEEVVRVLGEALSAA